MTALDRILTKAKVRGMEDCWEWTGSLSSGYGQCYFNKKVHRAHRVSFELHCGPIPHGMHVLHRCDNRKCINPRHLFLGTNSDNVADMIAKGRQRHRGMKGDEHPRSKLSSADVAAIRAETGVTQVSLAEKYGVCSQQISRIVRRKHWGNA